MASQAGTRWNIDLPIWNQATFRGRFKHFLWVTDPRLCFLPTHQLLDAKKLVLAYRSMQEPSTTTRADLVRAKQLFESSFHPDTGDLMNFAGRMSFQVPGGIALIGAMLIWYRSTSAVIFWQWANQSFNALVNYTNRNAKSAISSKQLITAYCMATSSALATALFFKFYFAKSGSLLQRIVPFIAVSAANWVNLPLMRQGELINGVVCTDENNNPVATSHYAPIKGISQVVISRIAIAAPAMLLVPVAIERLEKVPAFVRNAKVMNPIAQILLSGVILLPSVPFGCSIFPQRASIDIERLKRFDASEYDRVIKEYAAKGQTVPKKLYFNKGL